MLKTIEKTTLNFQNETSKKNRKEKAQFFTTLSIAKYMSSLSENFKKKKELNLLDCGAGTGILICSLIDFLMESKYTGKINMDLYENDENVLGLLKENMEMYKSRYPNLNINIIEENFILSNNKEWNDKNYPGRYDIAIANPPYKKIPKKSEESEIMDSIVYGQPNIYFLFMAMAAHLLKSSGEMIFITPRSFTSGAYFKAFRKYFLENLTITNVHIFHSRNKVFKGENVLQETIITKAVKEKKINRKVVITVSEGSDFSKLDKIEIELEKLISSCEEKFILIPSSEKEVEIINNLSKYTDNIVKLGFKLKTGKVVDFRATEYLTQEKKDAAPLIWPDNFISSKIENIGNENNFRYIKVSEKSKSLLQENKRYLLIKRLTSKEETKRIQPAIYNPEIFKENSVIAIENHVNFIDKLEEIMDREEQYGLFCYFNSTTIDNYYRLLNGNTQVNATEFNSIPTPNLGIIRELGKKLLSEKEITAEKCDEILSKYI